MGRGKGHALHLIASPEVEAKRQRPMKTNADLKTNAGFAAFFNAEVGFLFFFETGCLTVAQAGLELSAILLPQLLQGWDHCPPRTGGLPASSAAHKSPPLCPGAGFRGVPRRAAHGVGESVGPRLQRRHAPAPGLPASAPALRPHTPAPTSAAHPDEARGPTHSPWPRGRDALSRVVALLLRRATRLPR